MNYLVQLGFAADCFVASFEPSDTINVIPDRVRVLVRTPRGVELGTVLASQPESTDPSTLTIVRRVTRNDQLLIDRLQKHKIDAVRRCQKVLTQNHCQASLLDVDQLFDGNTLVLHFLGPVDAMGRELTDEIVKQYESEVQSIRLSELMADGCGPGCGTPDATGGGCGSEGGCTSCSVQCGVGS